MNRLRISISILAALILIFSPILQMDQLYSSMSPSSSDVCGESGCCCYPVDSPTEDEQSSGTNCQCRMSESNEPLDVEMNISENRIGRDHSIRLVASVVEDRVPEDVQTHRKSFPTYDAGKSPPVYILSCAFLI